MNINNYIRKKTGQKPEAKTAEEAILQYQGMSEEGLMSEMRRVAEQNRAQGSLSDTDLDSFYQSAQNMLTPEQAAKMKNLIEELKR